MKETIYVGDLQTEYDYCKQKYDLMMTMAPDKRNAKQIDYLSKRLFVLGKLFDKDNIIPITISIPDGE